RVPLEVRPQQRFQFRLVEHVGLWIPVDAAGGVAVELGECLESVVDQSQTERGSRNRGELVGDAEARDDAVDLVVQVHRPRLRVNTGPAIEDQAFDTVLRQERGGRDAGGSGPDDHDGYPLDRHAHANRTVPRWLPRSMLPSSVATDASTTSPAL